RTLAPIGFAEATGPEAGERLGRNRFDIEFAQEMEASVEHMNSEVRGAAAAGELFLGEPGADPGNVVAPKPEATRVINLPQVAALDDGLGDLSVAIEPEILRNHQCAPPFLRG